MSELPPADVAEFDPGRALRALEAHEVEYVVIGVLGAVAQGAPLLTTDLDVTPAPDTPNRERTAAALRDLDARLRTPHDPNGIPFPVDGTMLANADAWTLLTSAGALDLVFRPAGTTGYEDLARDARLVTIGGVQVRSASLVDIIRCKQASARPKDLQALPILRQTLEEVRRQEREARNQA